MEAGKLNRRITIQAPGTTQDEAGEMIEGWADVVTVWADVRYLGGLEVVKSNAPTSIAKASIRIRYRSGITAGMRALLGATVFDIRAVLPDEQGREYIDLVCEQGGNEG